MTQRLDFSKLSKEDLIKLLKLPDHLRKTLIAVILLREATATQVAEKTNRARAVESNYLNQLERINLLKRNRKGRTVYFSTT